MAPTFLGLLAERGVLAMARDATPVRLVTHRLIGDSADRPCGRGRDRGRRGAWGVPDWAALGVAWHTCAMARTRVSTTVDADLLAGARRVRSGITDAALIDEALGALLVRHRAAEVDASYAAYDKHPLDEPDEWGDLASFRQAAAAS